MKKNKLFSVLVISAALNACIAQNVPNLGGFGSSSGQNSSSGSVISLASTDYGLVGTEVWPIETEQKFCSSRRTRGLEKLKGESVFDSNISKYPVPFDFDFNSNGEGVLAMEGVLYGISDYSFNGQKQKIGNPNLEGKMDRPTIGINEKGTGVVFWLAQNSMTVYAQVIKNFKLSEKSFAVYTAPKVKSYTDLRDIELQVDLNGNGVLLVFTHDPGIDGLWFASFKISNFEITNDEPVAHTREPFQGQGFFEKEFVSRWGNSSREGFDIERDQFKVAGTKKKIWVTSGSAKHQCSVWPDHKFWIDPYFKVYNIFINKGKLPRLGDKPVLTIPTLVKKDNFFKIRMKADGTGLAFWFDISNYDPNVYDQKPTLSYLKIENFGQQDEEE